MTSSIAPVSSRKRALMETGDLRRRLRAHGHALKPLVHVGKGGVTPGVLTQLAQALFDHELVKVRIATECPVDRFAVADALAEQPGTSVAQLVGRVVLVYKRHPQSPRFEGKASRPADENEPPKRRPLNRRAAKLRTAKRRTTRGRTPDGGTVEGSTPRREATRGDATRGRATKERAPKERRPKERGPKGPGSRERGPKRRDK